jgi:hypothetical protein
MSAHLWVGAELKLEYASLYLRRMGESLVPRRSGLGPPNIDHDWQLNLYAHFDAFLPCTRSVAEIINCCFGKDDGSREMRDWFKKLSVDEQNRREHFTKLFQVERAKFDSHFLTKARNVTVHRAGHPPVTVAFNGFWGVRYQSNPTTRLPSHEVRPSDGSDMGWLGEALPVLPNGNDFEIGGRNLFSSCSEYIADAKDLLSKARTVAGAVHGSNPLTDPPAYASAMTWGWTRVKNAG